MRGIYSIEICGKLYVGKDSRIIESKRLKEHLNMLRNGNHFNKGLQAAFNQDSNYRYTVHFQSDNISLAELAELEIEFIEKLGSYEDGFNRTLGGIGGRGVKLDEKARKSRSERTIGELNPQAKLTNEQFYEIVELLKRGKTNSEIAEVYNLHDRYVSLIRHKKRFKNLWATVHGYVPDTSDGQRRGLAYKEFIEVVKLIRTGATNAEIERTYSLSAGTGSRIRHRKLYKKYWDIYDKEQKGATTIESARKVQ